MYLAMCRRGARFFIKTGSVLALFLTLTLVSACDTAADRAEKHYKSGMELLEKGDVDRALVEFRNVFKLNPAHHDARATYAKIERDRGNTREAISQYLKLSEQYPEDFEARLALSELALQIGNWDLLERHVLKAVELQPDNIKVQALKNALDYFKALQSRDDSALQAATDQANLLLAKDSTLEAARRTVIDGLIRDQRFSEALTQIDTALKSNPKDQLLLRIKLAVLQQLGDDTALRKLLEQMIADEPNNEGLRSSLTSFYVTHGQLDEAEALVREDAEKSDDPKQTQRYISFLFQYRGRESAVAEIERVIAAGRLEPVTFQTILARLKFDDGKRDEAITSLEAISEKGERTAGMRDLEIELAKMQIQTGNAVSARQLVERVLKEDPSNPGAVKLKAAWLIQDDNVNDALILLRDALASTPRDPDLFTLLAQAHDRAGNHELVAENLQLAVEAAAKAPAESIRYAKYLMSKDKDLAAEQVLIDALKLQSTNLDLLLTLGDLYVKIEKWPEADGVVRRLRGLDTDASKALASGLQARVLARQERSAELLSFLEGFADDTNSGKAAKIAILRTRIASNGAEDGLSYIDEQLAETPNDPEFRFLRAGTLMLLKRSDEALEIYRKLSEEFPQSDRIWVTLYRVYLVLGDGDAAKKTLDQALEQLPKNPALLMMKADQFQADKDFEGAISAYEELYKLDTNSPIAANNLASTLADHRTDEDSLKRAYAVARRLKDTKVPAFQDTYGWIAHRLGNKEEALPYLEGAAAGLPGDPRVQYHYAVALAENGQDAKALEQFQRVKSMLDAHTPTDFSADVDSEIERLSAAPKQ